MGILGLISALGLVTVIVLIVITRTNTKDVRKSLNHGVIYLLISIISFVSPILFMGQFCNNAKDSESCAIEVLFLFGGACAFVAVVTFSIAIGKFILYFKYRNK